MGNDRNGNNFSYYEMVQLIKLQEYFMLGLWLEVYSMYFLIILILVGEVLLHNTLLQKYDQIQK